MMWRATVTYLTDTGAADVVYELAELFELHDIIERGPNFYTVQQIVIVVADPYLGPLTAEESMQL